MARVQVPSIPVSKDFQSQQRALVTAFQNLVAQLNQPPDTTFDVGNNRVTGVLDPATFLDAVPLGYLQRALSTLQAGLGGGGGPVLGTTTIITTQAIQISYT